tara:strand:+ start:410 stop:829 length:420 start_codon:yes stop_codon:yes gene_type:complete
MLDISSNNDIINLKVSNEIIKCIKDVTNITEEEKKNITDILNTNKCDYEAVDNLRKYIKTSYYQQIDNVKYDRSLLLLADNLVKGQGDGRISDDDMMKLIKSAEDNNVITVCEKNTLYYIVKNYNTTDKAKQHLENYFK